MKKFEGYVKIGVVKRQSPNAQRAKSLMEESENKFKFLQISIKNIPKKSMNYNFVVESCYDIIIELIRAKMFMDGFNSKNSHEAEISYMEKIGFSEAEIKLADELRYSRNGIKYYGKSFDKDYAEIVLRFLNNIRPKFKF